MIYINILTHLREKLFLKQLPIVYKSKEIIFKINSTDDIEWDLIVIYEDIDYPYSFKCQEGKLLFISGEPPMVKVYSSKFLQQFNYVISAHSKLKHSSSYLMQQSLPWYFGYGYINDIINYSYEELEKLTIPEKTKNISFITSNRKFLPGHATRLKFLDELQIRYDNNIDFFGKGFEEIDDKSEALLPYRFSISLENSTINDYWTEKIADPILAYTVPLYNGCENINAYFPSNSYISLDIKKKSKTFAQLDRLMEKGDEIYKDTFPFLILSREKLLYEYNLFPMILSFMDSFISKSKSPILEYTIIPSTLFDDNKMKNYFLKWKRISYKIIEKLKT